MSLRKFMPSPAKASPGALLLSPVSGIFQCWGEKELVAVLELERALAQPVRCNANPTAPTARAAAHRTWELETLMEDILPPTLPIARIEIREFKKLV